MYVIGAESFNLNCCSIGSGFLSLFKQNPLWKEKQFFFNECGARKYFSTEAFYAFSKL